MQLFLLPPEVFCDTHINSQAKETAQILYSALIDTGLPAYPFSATVEGELKELKPYKRVWNHPCVFWAGSSIHALMWTLIHLTKICYEYQQRFGRRHLCSYHADNLCFHIHKHSDALTSKLGSSRNPADWLAKLTPHQRASVESRVSTLGAPPEVGYGVACMDPEFRMHVNKEIDLVESYLNFYVYKAKHQFPMRWCTTFDVPKYLQPAFLTYYPDQPVITECKRKRLRDKM